MNSEVLHIQKKQIQQDPQMRSGERGARKICVPFLYQRDELSILNDTWKAPNDGEKCPVFVTSRYEVSFFNQNATQKLHMHPDATEIYESIEGNFQIDTDDKKYKLEEGDFLVLHPGVIHRVQPSDTPFLGRVILIRQSTDKL